MEQKTLGDEFKAHLHLFYASNLPKYGIKRISANLTPKKYAKSLLKFQSTLTLRRRHSLHTQIRELLTF